MSSIDSGINSIATVITTEQRRSAPGISHVGQAKSITLTAGLLITVAAYGLSFLPDKWGVVDAMPRTFNAITAPLGGLFLVGMFLPRVGERAVIAGVAAGLATSVCLGYFEQLAPLLAAFGWNLADRTLSFTWIMPCSLTVTFAVSWLASFIEGRGERCRDGLTWQSRHVKPNEHKA